MNRQRAEYEYQPAHYRSKIMVVPEQKPVLRPIEDTSVLESTIFRSYLAWDFIDDQATECGLTEDLSQAYEVLARFIGTLNQPIAQ